MFINRIQAYNFFTSCIWTCSDNRTAIPCSELLICCSTGFLRICSVHFQDQSDSGQGNLPQPKTADLSGYFCSDCHSNHSMLPKSDFVFVVIFWLRAESLATDSDHRFHEFEITASQFQFSFVEPLNVSPLRRLSTRETRTSCPIGLFRSRGTAYRRRDAFDLWRLQHE